MTNRRILISAVVASIVVVLGTAAWFMFRAPASTTGAPIGITLLVNLRPHVEVTQGTPLTFELSIGSSRSSAGFDIGSRWWPWHELVRLEIAGSEGAIRWPLARVGTPRTRPVGRGSDGRPSVTEDTLAVARLEAGQHVHTVTFASGPEETASISPERIVFAACWRRRSGYCGDGEAALCHLQRRTW
jgi:hypothetical protein